MIGRRTVITLATVHALALGVRGYARAEDNRADAAAPVSAESNESSFEQLTRMNTRREDALRDMFMPSIQCSLVNVLPCRESVEACGKTLDKLRELRDESASLRLPDADLLQKWTDVIACEIRQVEAQRDKAHALIAGNLQSSTRLTELHTDLIKECGPKEIEINVRSKNNWKP